MTRRELLNRSIGVIGSMFGFMFIPEIAKANSRLGRLSSIILHYDDSEMDAPIVLASTKVLEEEEEYKTALCRCDAILFSAHANMLIEKYSSNTFIKREDYKVVAEMLAYLYKLKGRGVVKSWCIYEG